MHATTLAGRVLPPNEEIPGKVCTNSEYGQVFDLSVVAYQTSLYLTKCTLIVQYIRIFGMSRRTHVACWTALVFLTFFNVGLLIVSC